MMTFDITDDMIYAAEEALLNTYGSDITDPDLAKSNVFRLIKVALEAANIRVVDCRIATSDD
jgi:hypothetical protein